MNRHTKPDRTLFINLGFMFFEIKEFRAKNGLERKRQYTVILQLLK